MMWRYENRRTVRNFLVMLAWGFALDVIAEQNTPSPAALPEAGQGAVFAELQRKLPAGMSIAKHGHIVILEND